MRSSLSLPLLRRVADTAWAPWKHIAFAAGALLLALGGCGPAGEDAALHEPPGAAFQAAEGTRTQALAALDSLQRDALDQAFQRLGDFAYQRRVRTEQRAPEGKLVAFEERTVRHAAGGSEAGTAPRLVQSDSSGAFDLGMLGRFASTDVGVPASDLTQQVFSEEPSFLSERNRHAFQYRLLPDTTLPGGVGQARVVAVRARSGPDGEKQTIRRARLYLDAESHQLVALRLHRQRETLLFDEDTRQFMRLRRAATANASVWVPGETRFATTLDMPLRPTRRFRSTASYDQYRTAPS